MFLYIVAVAHAVAGDEGESNSMLQAKVRTDSPKLLHRIFGLGEFEDTKPFFCDPISEWRKDFDAGNQGWEEWVWSRPEVEALVKKETPRLEQAMGLDNFTLAWETMQYPWVLQADAARYLILWVYGGLYLDIDISCGSGVDRFLENLTEASPVIMRSKCKNHAIASMPGEQVWVNVLKQIVINMGGSFWQKTVNPVTHLTGEHMLCGDTNHDVEAAIKPEKLTFFDDVLISNTDGAGLVVEDTTCVHHRSFSWRRELSGMDGHGTSDGDAGCPGAYENAIAFEALQRKAKLDEFVGKVTTPSLNVEDLRRVWHLHGRTEDEASAQAEEQKAEEKADQEKAEERKAEEKKAPLENKAPLETKAIASPDPAVDAPSKTLSSVKTELEKTEKQDTATDMVAVVNNFEQEKDLAWIRVALSTVEVGRDDLFPKSVSEALPWVQWIANNYENLPEYVAFLHGDQETWHASHVAKHIAQLRPENVTMLANPICRQLTEYYSGMQKELLDVVVPALFGMSMVEAYDQFHLATTKCCSEMVVSRAAIRRTPHEIYLRLAGTIRQTQDRAWARVMERVWEPLFSQQIMPVDHVLAALDNFVLSRKDAGLMQITVSAEETYTDADFMASAEICGE